MTNESTPHRVQLSRKAGWRKPDNTLCVSRPSKWGNPFKVGETYAGVLVESNAQAVALFRAYLLENPALVAEARQLLTGKHLACWCKLNEPCHADVWLEILQEAAAS